MKWECETAVVERTLSVSIGDARLFIHSPNREGKRWISVVASTGTWVKIPQVDAKRVAPHMAAQMLRDIADQLESECDA